MSSVGWPEGTLLKEQGRDEVYLIRDGARLHIPNEYVLESIGYPSKPIKVVDQGSLNNIPLEHWPTLGTPGSTVIVPGTNNPPLDPVEAVTSKVHKAWGQDVRTIELRRWLTNVAEGCNPVDPDWHYDLLVDSGWALSRGIDLHTIVWVGNILQLGTPEPVGFRNFVSLRGSSSINARHRRVGSPAFRG